MHCTRHTTVDGFFAEASAMRRVLDRRLGDTQDPFDPSRFAWEAWHVDGQFSQLRTPARGFFPAPLLAAFEARLLRWAGGVFGVSEFGGPPWLSILVDGGFQALHRDGPNGEIAVSFGLGKSGRFRGGETLVARDDLLDYFGSGAYKEERADTPLFDEIPPRLNRLVAFDSRIPHAVRAVEGPRHPKDGRIALQGWLRVNGCIVHGHGSREEATTAVNRALARIPETRLTGADGLVTVQLDVGEDGRVRKTRLLASTLARTCLPARTRSREDAPARAAKAILAALSRLRMASAVSGRLVVPVVVSDRTRHARVPTAAKART